MLGRTAPHYVFLATAAAAQPQSFTLDIGSIEGAVVDSLTPMSLLDTSSEALSSMILAHTTLSTLPMSTPTPISAPTTITHLTFIATALNHITSTTCLPTTTVVITLPNPTPTPNADTLRGEDEGTLTDDEQDGAATPFDTASPEPLSKWPHWFTAATLTLVFYDVFSLGIFLWLWVFGYLWWFQRGGGARGSQRRWRRGGVLEGPMETGRVDGLVSDRSRWYERTRERERIGRGYGRVRSESWERARSVREGELESEMRRLGMI